MFHSGSAVSLSPQSFTPGLSASSGGQERSSAQQPPTIHRSAARVIVVDDDPSTVTVFDHVLRKAGFDVQSVGSLDEALIIALGGFDLMLLDVKLGDDDGLDVLRALTTVETTGRVLVMTGFDLWGVEAEARSLGAIGYVDKPILDVVATVRQALLKTPPTNRFGSVDGQVLLHAMSRWAEMLVSGLCAREDPKTLEAWGHAVGKARTVIREVCVLADLSPKRSLDLLRVLRAVGHASNSGWWRPAQWLNVSDRRSLSRLLTESGLTKVTHVPNLRQVLRTQNFIVDPFARAELCRALRRAGFLPQ